MDTQRSQKPDTAQTIAEIKRRSGEALYAIYNRPATRMTLELAITISTVLLLAVAAIRPTLLAMSQLLKDIEDRKKTEAALTTKIQTLSSLSVEILPLQSDLKKLDQVISNVPDMNGLLRRIEKIASVHNITLSTLQSDVVPKDTVTEKSKSEMQTYELSIQIKGPFAAIKTFINALQKMDRYVTVQSITITSKSNTQETDIQQATLIIQVHYFGSPAKIEENAANQPTNTGKKGDVEI